VWRSTWGSKEIDHVRTKKKFHLRAIVPIFLILAVFLGLAVLQPPAVDAYTLSEYLEGAAAGAMAGGAIGGLAGGGVGAIPGAMAGLLITPVVMYLTEHNSNAYQSSGAAAVYCQNLRNNTDRAMESYWQNAENLVNLYDTSGFMYARYAASAADMMYDYQTAHNISHVYSAEYVLSNSPIMNDMMSIMNQSLGCYNNLFKNYVDLSQTFIGDESSCTWGLNGASPGTCISSYSSNARLDMEWTYKINCGNGQYVYLPKNATITLFAATGTGASALGFTVKNANGTTIFSDNAGTGAGEVRVYHLNNSIGRYSITEAAPGYSQFFGLAAPDITNSGSVVPCVIPVHDVGNAVNFWYPCSWGSDSTHDGQVSYSYGSGSLFFEVNGAGNSQWTTISLQKHFNALHDVQNNYSSMIAIANNAGQTQFNAQVASNGTTPRISPDIAFLDPNQMKGLTYQQMYAIYVAYLNAMKGYFENYSQMSPGFVNVSGESFDLICRGAIYNENGVQIFDNQTIFTPYISLADMTLVIGNNSMTQPGYFLTWARGSSIASTDLTNATSIRYVQFKAGTKFHIEEMTFKGARVTTQTLTVTKLVWVYGDQGQNETRPPQSITDTQWLIAHWYLFALVLGVILLMAAVMTRSMVVVVIGVIALLAGAIGWYLAGDTLFGIHLAIQQSWNDWFWVKP
jgi:hypothetical protein